MKLAIETIDGHYLITQDDVRHIAVDITALATFFVDEYPGLAKAIATSPALAVVYEAEAEAHAIQQQWEEHEALQRESLERVIERPFDPRSKAYVEGNRVLYNAAADRDAIRLQKMQARYTASGIEEQLISRQAIIDRLVCNG